eukprot:scaffold9424_cov27-Tisochrysis_lutea.AAC.1
MACRPRNLAVPAWPANSGPKHLADVASTNCERVGRSGAALIHCAPPAGRLGILEACLRGSARCAGPQEYAASLRYSPGAFGIPFPDDIVMRSSIRATAANERITHNLRHMRCLAHAIATHT